MMKPIYFFIFWDLFDIGDIFTITDLTTSLMIARPTALKFIRGLLADGSIEPHKITHKVKQYIIVRGNNES